MSKTIIVLFCLAVFAAADTKDWANLARYAKSSAELAKLPPGTNEVVFIGSSTIDNWDKKGVFFPGKHYVNRGIGGQTSREVLERFPQDVIQLQPKAVLIQIGSNDIAAKMTMDEIKGKVKQMIQISNMYGIKVILASLNPTCGNVSKSRPPEVFMAYNAWLKSYAEENGHTYVDYYSYLVGPDGYFRKELNLDCLHANAAGYAIMSPLTEVAIDKALGRK